MKRNLLLFLLVTLFPITSYAQYSLSGRIVNDQNGEPVAYATINVENQDIWTTADKQGNFKITDIPAGKNVFVVSSIGMVTTSFRVVVSHRVNNLQFRIKENNLTLEKVNVSGTVDSENLSTTYKLDRLMLEHAQVSNLHDISSLLPGGQTPKSDNIVSGDSRFYLRSESGQMGNPDFGTAIEIDGVRLNNNAATDGASDYIKGASTRNIGVSNIESIEVISGAPSVEHGDLTNGLIRVRTSNGKTPLRAQVSIKPRLKQYSIGKGVEIGNAGVINFDFDRTKSVTDIASPYTTYDRNALTLTYANTFNKNGRPIKFKAGVSGNIGGYDSKSDPDMFVGTYNKERDNTLRANMSANWLLRLPWITSLELSATGRWSDNLNTVREKQDRAYSSTYMHSTQEGYYLSEYYDDNPNAPAKMIPRGNWFYRQYNESKPVDYSVRLKANWAKNFGEVNSRFLLGVEYTASANKGRGIYYDDMRYAPTWREQRYDSEPFVNNYALYAEETAIIPVRDQKLELSAGVRSDFTHISGSEYGTVSGVVPRLRAKYTFIDNRDAVVSNLSLKASFGESVKLPSYSVLFPRESYRDELSFAGRSVNDGTSYTVYHTFVSKAAYNPDLKWQRSTLRDIGIEATIKGVYISLSAYSNKSRNPYVTTSVYTPVVHNLTTEANENDTSHPNYIPIPVEDRIYTIDQNGLVTVSDKNDNHAAQQLVATQKTLFVANSKSSNGSPSVNRGLEWIVDFGQIKSLNTSFRVDGKYNYYKGMQNHLVSSVVSNVNNSPKYIAYYSGSTSGSNGLKTQRLNTNLIITTHIPKIRLIVSARLEATFVNSRQYLSSAGRSFGIDNFDDNTPSPTNPNHQDANYAAMYPEYYSTHDDVNTLIPFAEKFEWARLNDPALYNELKAMVKKTSNNVYYKENRISPYFSSTISVTKEIGNFASLSFTAANFLNNMGKVRSSQTGLHNSLYNNTTYIPEYYYGLSLRIKL